MKIEVGEYVRTNTGKFDKVINNNYYMPQYIECEKSIVNKENIAKHSKNIIDLLQEGDFANGYKIIRINYKDKWIVIQNINKFGENGKKVLLENEIETILTKEQYMQNCYTVERKEEC